MKKIGFDNDKYLQEQADAIIDRASRFDNKLYLEFGGKLVFDYHASRILPGFDPNVKIKLLQRLKDKIDIVICIYAGDIARKKIRADFGITYDADTLKLIDDLRDWGLEVKAICVTRYEEQPAVKSFINKLKRRGINVYTHRAIKGYPTEIDTIISDDGYGANAYIESDKPIVIITGPGPGSGKMATCLSQVYHEHERGVSAGYAKFETFPIWSIPLKHPINIAYEAATADIADFNQVDPFHLEAYGEAAINYNRDVEIFPVVKRIMSKIMDNSQLYQSPTDMGVNRAGFAICDDDVCCEASKQEIIRRYFRYKCEYAMGLTDKQTVDRVKLLMNELEIKAEDRCMVEAARKAASDAEDQEDKGNEGVYCGAALQLPNGQIVTGKNSPLMHAASSAVLNAIKKLGGLPDELLLISPDVIESVGSLKRDILKSKRLSLDLEETMIALSVSMPGNPSARLALEKLEMLHGCEMHITHIPTPGDEAGLRKLGVNLTCDSNFAGKNLFVD
ncbi:MAG: DUF1846 domain-containing protein [Lentisphaerae bacterium]|nr:DUF1846 domain-containing protein [Lentisphaerota bacterium]MCP4102118.1 DUF1846 domain-containing protein [Lentisphaerota bacterium]